MRLDAKFLRCGITALSFHLAIAALPSVIASAASGEVTIATPETQRADFFAALATSKAAFRHASRNPLGREEARAIIEYAELAFIESSVSDRMRLVESLRQTERTTDPHLSRLALAWRLQFQTLLELGKAEAALHEAPSGDRSSVSAKEARRIIAPVLIASTKARAEIAKLQPGHNRDAIQGAADLSLALALRSARNESQAREVLETILNRRSWSDRNSPLLLYAHRLRAILDYEARKPTTAILDALENAEKQALRHWAYHPALTLAEFTIAEIASDAKLRDRGREALARVSHSSLNDSFDWLKFAELAFDLDDIDMASPALLRGIRLEARSADTTSEAWRNGLKATLELTFSSGEPTKHLILISTLLRERDLVPDPSPARRWALLKLAKGYLDAGEGSDAAALAKIAANNPLPKQIQQLLELRDPDTLYEAAMEFDTSPDYDAKAKLFSAAIETSIGGRRSSISDKLLLAGQFLVTNKMMLGEAAQASSTIELLLRYVREMTPRFASSKDPDEASLIKIRVGLDSLARRLDEAGLESLGNEARRIGQDLIKLNIQTFVEFNLQSRRRPSEYLYKVDQVSGDLFAASRPWLALSLYVNDVLPMVLSPSAPELRDTDWKALLASLGSALTRSGDDMIAQQLRVNGARVRFSVLEKISPPKACAILKATFRTAMRDPSSIKSFPDLIEALSLLPCNGDTTDPIAGGNQTTKDSVASNWTDEERRLRSLSASLSNVAQPARLTNGECTLLAGSTPPDDLRRSILAELDDSYKSALQNGVQQAELLQQLAALYDPKETHVPIALRKIALDLLLDKTTLGPEDLANSTICLLRNIYDANQSSTAGEAVRELARRIAVRYGGDAAERFRGALKLKPDYQFMVAESQLGLKPTTDSSDVEDLEQALDRFRVETTAPRAAAVNIASLLRRMPTPAYQDDRVRQVLREYTDLVHAKFGRRSDLATVIPLFEIKREFLDGSFERALTMIERLGQAERTQPWADFELSEFQNWRTQFLTYANEIKDMRRTSDQLRDKAKTLTKPEARPGHRAVFLSKLIEASIRAHDYKLLLQSFRELISIEVPIEDQEGFIAREGVVDLVGLASSACLRTIQIALSRSFENVIADCASTAISMAAMASSDKLHRNRKHYTGEIREDVAWDAYSLLQNVSPLLAGRSHSHQNDVGAILGWYVAARATAVSVAAGKQASLLLTTKGSQADLLADWHRKRVRWLHAESRYQCGLTSGNLRPQLSLNADRTRGDISNALRSLSEALAPGTDLPRLPELAVDKLRSALRADEAILSFAVSGDNILVWVVRNAQIHFKALESVTLHKDISSLVGQTSNLNSSGGLAEFRVQEAHRIYSDLIAPVADNLVGVTKLFIETDATTSRIPFAALISSKPPVAVWSVNEQSWSPEWLAKRYSISIIPSLATFASNRNRARNPSRQILAAGDPMVGASQVDNDECSQLLSGPVDQTTFGRTPGAAEELSEVMSVAADKARLLTGADFVPDNLKSASLRPYGVLIFATHGQPETTTRPARLLFSPTTIAGTTRANYMTASEVYELDLDADLVILSACDSGIRDGSRGGLNSLVPAFLWTGAKQVIATAWPIGASTANALTVPLIQHYVKHGATDIDQVLQETVRSMMNATPGSSLRHPYFWAGIFLVGPSWRP